MVRPQVDGPHPLWRLEGAALELGDEVTHDLEGCDPPGKLKIKAGASALEVLARFRTRRHPHRNGRSTSRIDDLGEWRREHGQLRNESKERQGELTTTM